MLSSCSITEEGKCQKGSRRAFRAPCGPGSQDAAGGGRREERGVRPARGPGCRGRSGALGAPAAAEGEGEPKSDVSPLSLQAPANGPRDT